MTLHHLMLKLDLIRLSITGHFKDCADDLVDRYDVTPFMSDHDVKLAVSIVKLSERGTI